MGRLFGAGRAGTNQPGAQTAGTQGQADELRLQRRRRIRWAVRLVVLLVVVGVMKFVGLDSKFYYPDDEVYYQPSELGLKHEDVRFRSAGGVELAGWFLPAMGAAKGLVVHMHGNAANISNHVELVEWLPKAGYHVLMFDYRGYGESEGKVTRKGTINDAHAAIDYALSRPEARGLPLFVYGQSLGGAIGLVVTADRPEVVAVVAESPFSSYRRVAARHVQKLVKVGWLASIAAAMTISGGYDPIDFIDQISPRPVLIIGAEEDQICFAELARELYEAAGEPRTYWEAPGAQHLGIMEECPEELIEQVSKFFEKAGRGKVSQRV